MTPHPSPFLKSAGPGAARPWRVWAEPSLPSPSARRAAPSPRRALAAVLVLAALATPAWALSDPVEMLHDPAQEARAEQVGSQLRCLVCQNESIEDSGAGLARDLRAIVRQRVVAGDSDQQVIAWMVARYGNFVRLSPPLGAATLLLWASPVLALVAGLGAAWLARRGSHPGPAPLSDTERTRLAELTTGPR